MQLLYLKHKDNLKSAHQIVYYFINALTIHGNFIIFTYFHLYLFLHLNSNKVKNKTTDNNSIDLPINVNDLIEELVAILYLNSKPEIHSKILRFIRYYFKSYVVQNFEFFVKMLDEISSL